MSTNTYWHDHQIDLYERARQKNQEPLAIWFTGLSASGKSTIAGALEQVLTNQGYHTYLLDGNNIRFGLCKDLGFGDADRTENIRRIGEVAKLMTDAGLIALTAFISPFRQDRKIVRKLFPDQRFIEVFIDADITTCQARDPKGLYARALKGEIKKLTGIDSPYEAPQSPEILIDTNSHSVDTAVNQILAYTTPALSKMAISRLNWLMHSVG